MKRFLGCATAAASLLILVVPATPGSADAAPLAPVVRVRPAVGLVDGQVVRARGRGYTPGANIAVIECRAGATTANDCDASTVVFTPASATGEFVASLTVRSRIATPGGNVKCTSAPGACIVAAANFDNQTEAAGTPITFGT